MVDTKNGSKTKCQGWADTKKIDLQQKRTHETATEQQNFWSTEQSVEKGGTPKQSWTWKEKDGARKNMSPICLNFFRMHVCARAESWKIAKLEDCKSWKIAKLEESSIQIFPATIQTRLANLSFNLFWCCPRFLQMPTISCKFYFFQCFGVLLCRPVWRLFWCPNSVFSFEVSIFFVVFGVVTIWIAGSFQVFLVC